MLNSLDRGAALINCFVCIFIEWPFLNTQKNYQNKDFLQICTSIYYVLINFKVSVLWEVRHKKRKTDVWLMDSWDSETFLPKQPVTCCMINVIGSCNWLQPLILKLFPTDREKGSCTKDTCSCKSYVLIRCNLRRTNWKIYIEHMHSV